MLKNLLQKWFGGRSEKTVIFALRLEKFELGWWHRLRRLRKGKFSADFFINTTTFVAEKWGYEVPWDIGKVPITQVTASHRIAITHVKRLHAFFEHLRERSKERDLYLRFDMDEDMSTYISQHDDVAIFEYCLRNFKGYRLVKPTDEKTWKEVVRVENITLEEIYNASRRKSSNDT